MYKQGVSKLNKIPDGTVDAVLLSWNTLFSHNVNIAYSGFSYEAQLRVLQPGSYIISSSQIIASWYCETNTRVNHFYCLIMNSKWIL
jgi:hypothetical protein